MKRILPIIAIFMFSIGLGAQTCTPGPGVTCTTNLNLWIPSSGYVNWGPLLNYNWGILDAASARWANLNASSNSFSGSITAAGFTGPLTGNATTATNLSGTQAQNLVYASPNGSSGVGGWRAIVAADIPILNQNTTGTSGGLTGSPAITVSGLLIGSGVSMTGNQGNGLLIQHSTGAVTNGHCGQFDTNGNIVDAGFACGSGGGSVTSVGMTVPSWLTVAGSPITSSGTLAVSATTGLTANQFLATPDGVSGSVGLRAMVANDVPALPESKITNLTTDLAGKVSTATTVNGHALSSNVVVSASDITTGTLPYAQLPVAPVTITISAFSANPNTCYNNTGTVSWQQGTGTPTPTSTTMTGLTTAMAPHWTATADISQVVGWGAVGGMDLRLRSSAGAVLSYVCNMTASSISQGGFTANVEP